MKKTKPSTKKQFFRKPAVIIAGSILVFLCICISLISIASKGSQKPQTSEATSVGYLYTQAASTVIAQLTSTSLAVEVPTQIINHIATQTVTVAVSTLLPPADTSTVSPTSMPTSIQTGPFEVDFINVGQGDSELITTTDGKRILVDGGEANGLALSYLKSKGVQKIDLMIATHPHSDHIGGLVQILQSMPVGQVVTNGQPHTTTTYENFIDAISTAKVPYSEAKRGDTLTVGSLTMNVLSPTTTEGDMNNNSLVLRFTMGGTTYLFMGDAQTEAEASILAAGLPVKADILKVGHHGSRTASSPAFLAAVKPAVAVYSAGIGNSYGHPHAETIAALSALGVQIYGTDLNGTVAISQDGAGYKVITSGGPRAPPVIVAPTAEPTEAPTLVATEPPASTNLTLEITNVSSSVSKGGQASLSATTIPGASCTITVYYKSGPSKAQGLGPQISDGNGNVSWSWKVGSNTTSGTWRIVVTATLNGKSVTKETSFTVQ